MLNKQSAVKAKNRESWRKWLQENHQSESSVWLIFFKKDSGVPSVTYSEAVDEALCFGWIDSKPSKRDEQSYYRFFSKRNPKSSWSKVNKQKVEKLLSEGRMTEAGLKAVALAKRNGNWDALNEVEKLFVPEDLKAALEAVPNAQQNFEAFPPSSKRAILEWIQNAKREETRSKRVKETAELAGQNIRANHWKPKK